MLINTDGGDKVAALPECTLGEFLGFLLDPGAGFALEYLEYVRYGVLGWDGDIQVDVFVSDVPRLDVAVFPEGDVFELTFQFLFNILVFEYRSPVLGTPHDVVVTHPGSVCLLIESARHG